MNISFKTKLSTSIAWVVFTVIFIAVILWQIYANQVDYQFYFNNILFIIVGIVFMRYIFLLKHTFIENKIIIKLILMPIAIFVAIYSYMALNDFIDFYQEYGKYANLQHLPLEKQYSLGDYIFGEYIFFGVIAVITSIILPIRLLISVWRVYNKGHE